MNRCPACGKELAQGEAHLGKLFDTAPWTQFKTVRFVICDESAKQLEAMLKMYREARMDELMNVNFY